MKKSTVFQNFLDISTNSSYFFKKDYDEPTYLSVRINFFPNGNDTIYSMYNDPSTMTYNDMPHPLLEETGKYSTITYLRNNLGDERRAKLLENFIAGIKSLNNDCPYYIKSISGLADLLNIDPKRGSRVAQSGRLVLNCIEGLDMRINYLLNAYRKIAWDDVYQRWILPDMMRYFTMEILISEFRLFYHNAKDEFASDTNLIVPTIKYTCQMCEFDISNTIDKFNELYIDEIRTPLDDIQIKIKVGNVIEHDRYDMFASAIDINDLLLSRYITQDNNDKSTIWKNNYYAKYHKLYVEDDSLINDVSTKISNAYKDASGNVMNISDVPETAENYNDKFKNTYEHFLNSTTIEKPNYVDYNHENKVAQHSDDISNKDGKIYEYAEYNKKSYSQNAEKAYQQKFKDNDKAIDKATKRNNVFGSLINNISNGTLQNLAAMGRNYIDDITNQLLYTYKFPSGLTANDYLSVSTSDNLLYIFSELKTRAEAFKTLYPEVSQATNGDIDVNLYLTALNKIASSGATTDSGSKFAKMLTDISNSSENSIDAYNNKLSQIIINEYANVTPDKQSVATDKIVTTKIKQIL